MCGRHVPCRFVLLQPYYRSEAQGDAMFRTIVYLPTNLPRAVAQVYGPWGSKKKSSRMVSESVSE